jgi:prepilin peptidase CpaA
MIFFVLCAAVLITVSINDIANRTVRHRYLLILAVLLLFQWIDCPNTEVLPFSLFILVVGFVLHVFKILGAGDTKLLFVISLGVSPDNLSLLFFGIAFFSAVLVFVYLLVAAVKGMADVRRRGLPMAVPISCSGMVSILVSNCS